MAERLTEYRASTLSDILSAKKFIEAIVNSINAVSYTHLSTLIGSGLVGS